jgi:hypothetical protein
LQSATRDREVRPAIENERDRRADEQLGGEKRDVARVEQVSHQAVALRRQTVAHPENSQLRVEPVQQKQQQAFRQCAHRSSGSPSAPANLV